MFEVLILLVLPYLVACEEFTVYTHPSIRDDNGEPCLSGCSPETNECFINWEKEKRTCTTLNEPAPIYFTSQFKKPRIAHCLSNCDTFGETYEWCVTTKDFNNWDYCSRNTNRSFLRTGQLQGVTSSKITCSDQCSKGRDTYFWCHFKIRDSLLELWETCAPTAVPRIPVLQNNFHTGARNKGKCDDFLRYTNDFDKSVYSTSSDLPDNYVTGIAEAIEATGSNILAQVITLNEYTANPVKSYSMVKIGDLMVPAVIRAQITKDSINLITNSTAPFSAVESKLRQQMSGTIDSYEAGTLIGFDLGGPNAEYNVVPRPPNWYCDDWADMEESVIHWCRKTGGSVEMLIVVFYRDSNTPIPNAFGVSQVFRNADNSLFVDCREKIYWNNF